MSRHPKPAPPGYWYHDLAYTPPIHAYPSRPQPEGMAQPLCGAPRISARTLDNNRGPRPGEACPECARLMGRPDLVASAAEVR